MIRKKIQINGGILIKEYGYQPGPDLGEILTEIEYAIVDGELENDRQAIHAYLREKKMSDFIVEKLSKSVGDRPFLRIFPLSSMT